MEIRFYHREKAKIELEKVYGDSAVKWLYGSTLGKILTPVICSAPISKIYGFMQSSALIGHRKIKPFIRDFNINMDEYLPQSGLPDGVLYTTFNNFFIRQFKPGKRPFNSSASTLPAFAEARYFGWEKIETDLKIPVKGEFLAPQAIIANDKWNTHFKNGPLLLARLCPVDYHRFHFPDDGKVLDSYRISGAYHSVNPLALKEKEDILCTNERHVTILETAHLGKLAYVEVGAAMVGKIVQSYSSKEFKRGEEKGYFLFGGSTVIVIGEEGCWSPDQDILKYSRDGIETYIKLGDSLAKKV